MCSTVPTDKQPPTLDHGDMFFFVSQRPGQQVSYEPQFIAGYTFQEGSKATVTIDKKSFSMFTRGKSAWVENAAEEPVLIAAMKTGTDMKVTAKSGRGNPTSYVFSLKGISARRMIVDRQVQIGLNSRVLTDEWPGR